MNDNIDVVKILQQIESESYVTIECSDEISVYLLSIIHETIPSTGIVFTFV